MPTSFSLSASLAAVGTNYPVANYQWNIVAEIQNE
jgi:hypothetical protein